MKTSSYFIITVVLILVCTGCTTKQNKYEKAIAAYVQTDKHGTWTDLQFKALSMEESPCTVADSIKILRAEFEQGLTVAIDSENKNMEYWKSLLADKPSSKMAEHYGQNIAGIQARIDSLKTMSPPDEVRYADLPSTEVLVVTVKCHYSYVMPGSKSRQERTETFLLSPEGETVLGKVTDQKKP